MQKKKSHFDLSTTAFAFRGYNITNLGRSNELLSHKSYGSVVKRHLNRASQICSDVLHKKVDLVHRVRENRETDLNSYADALALIVATELAQLEILEKFFGVRYCDSKLAFGYSLGEITALCAAGVFDVEQALKIPLSLTNDCIEMANDTSMGILISRGEPLNIHKVNKICLSINSQGKGLIGISSFLSPNSILLLAEKDTIDRFKSIAKNELSKNVHLKKNPKMLGTIAYTFGLAAKYTQSSRNDDAYDDSQFYQAATSYFIISYGKIKL